MARGRALDRAVRTAGHGGSPEAGDGKYEKPYSTGNHWLQVRLQGVRTNRDGVGAHVKVVAGDLALIDEVHSGRGYQSHWGTRLHFGLGRNEKVRRIEVHWPRSGVVDILENVPVDRVLSVTEGSAPSKEKPFFTYPLRGKKQG